MGCGMTAPVDVLAVLDSEIASLPVIAHMVAAGGVVCDVTDAIARLTEARDAVAELIETGRRAEVSFNTVRYCYTRAPGNFAVAMSELDSDIAPFRAALACVGAP